MVRVAAATGAAGRQQQARLAGQLQLGVDQQRPLSRHLLALLEPLENLVVVDVGDAEAYRRAHGYLLPQDEGRMGAVGGHVGGTQVPLVELREFVAQVEVAIDDTQCVLVLRLLQPLSDQDEVALRDFAAANDVCFYTQSGGPDTISPLGESADLAYRLADFNVELHFEPGDFTQVNTDVNRMMIAQAMGAAPRFLGSRAACALMQPWGATSRVCLLSIFPYAAMTTISGLMSRIHCRVLSPIFTGCNIGMPNSEAAILTGGGVRAHLRPAGLSG